MNISIIIYTENRRGAPECGKGSQHVDFHKRSSFFLKKNISEHAQAQAGFQEDLGDTILHFLLCQSLSTIILVYRWHPLT